MSESRRQATGPGVALALQGGGAHGAFTWGVLDRLLEDGLEVAAISGVSSGAITGAMFAQGWARAGRDGARAELARLWERVMRGQGGALSDAWMWPSEILHALAWRGMEAMLRVFSPAQLNPSGHNPLRAVVRDLLNPALLVSAAAPRLHVSVTDVATGEPVTFDNAAITAEILLASACVPLLFAPIQIEGRAYWDGGCAGNPPLAPLLASDPPPSELIVVRAHPVGRKALPGTPGEIINRLNEIACHNILRAELALVPPSCRVRVFDADAALGGLPLSSKFRADPAVIRTLFAAGRAAAAALAPPPAPAEVASAAANCA